MKTTKIKYTFRLPDNDIIFDYTFDKENFSLIKSGEICTKEWVKLDFHKCNHCPLDPEEHKVCPLANAIDDIIQKLDSNHSYEHIFVEVDTANRRISKMTTMQIAIRSILGLIFPTSGCPHTSFFRPMARFHLPFSDSHETVYRALSMFLLGQFFKNKELKNEEIKLNFSELERIYNNITIVDEYICKRLKAICKKDASINAVAILHSLSITMEFAMKREFQKLKPLFSAYLYGLNEQVK